MEMDIVVELVDGIHLKNKQYATNIRKILLCTLV